jgi:secondary thiamine-phosphate synthase enzyme
MDSVDLRVHPLAVHQDRIELWSEEPTQFLDITEWVARSVGGSGVAHGIAQIRVLHTTAAIVVNEKEPLLLEDFRGMLERFAPERALYSHDDPARRRVNREPGERRNGHAHVRALLLGDTKHVGVTAARLELGRWQSIFLVELDGPRKRSVSLTVIGRREDCE